jgi:hypothetical protein
MTTITEDIDLPDGTDPSSVCVSLQLWGATVPVTGSEQGTGKSIAGVARATGTPWTISNVVGNTAIDAPTGTVYKLTRTWPGLRDPLIDYITVPATGGPYRVDQILTTAPAAVDPSGLAAHAANALLHGGGQLLGYADRATSFPVTSTSPTDVTGLTITFVVPPGPFVLECGAFCLVEEGIAGAAAVTSGSRTSGVSTLNTAAAHGLTAGQVAVINVQDTTYNGAFALATGSGTTLTYAQTGVANDAASGTGTVGSAASPGGGGTLILALSDNTVIGQDGTRARVSNDLAFVSRRVVLPNWFHTPTPGATVTYKVRANTSHVTSDFTLLATLFANDAPYISAYTLGEG